jgi:hypothetical protein
MSLTRRAVAVGLITVGSFLEKAQAADYQLISVEPGQNVDLYFEINLSGEVFLRIGSRGGSGCADFWWINWPFGNLQSLGSHCGAARFKIPGLTSFAIASKLRAGGVTEPTKIVAAASEQVANSVPITW